MYTGILHLHSSLRYLILLFLVITIVNSIVKRTSAYTKNDDRLSLITFILTHIQLLIGLGLYIFGPKGIQLFSNGMDVIMSNRVLRFFAVEHIVGMLVAIALITIGRIKMKKKTTDAAKHKTTWIYYLIALIILFISIPWPFIVPGYGWYAH